MKRAYFLCIMLLLSLFSCTAEEQKISDGDRVSEYFSGLDNLSMTANVTAQFTEYSVDFALFASFSGAKGSVKVLEPAHIEGISVLSDEDGTEIEYDGAAFEVGELEQSGISPALVLPELLRLWRGGGVSESCREKLDGTECVVLSYVAGELFYRTWFHMEALEPLRAEIIYNGTRTMICAFSGFSAG